MDFLFECREFLSAVKLKCVSALSSVNSCMELMVFAFIAIAGFSCFGFFFSVCFLFRGFVFLFGNTEAASCQLLLWVKL